jgi:hypothetical protein
VARYVRQVNRIEGQLARPLANITTIGAQFARAQGVAGGSVSGFVEQGTMLGALRQVARLRVRLASLATPPPAIRLRAALLQLIDAQVQMARRLQKLVVFLPRFNAALRPLGADIKRLEVVLTRQSAYGAAAVAAVYAQKAAALRSFRASLESILAKLHRLDPPAVSKPDYDAQLSAVSGMAMNAGKLADALERNPQGNVQPLLAAFDRAAAGAQSPPAVRAHSRAVRAYNRQVARVNQLSQDAELERTRLASTLR